PRFEPRAQRLRAPGAAERGVGLRFQGSAFRRGRASAASRRLMNANRAMPIASAAGAVPLGIAAYHAHVDRKSPTSWALAVVALAWTFVAAGAFTWLRRPGNRVGPLLIAVGFAVLARQFRFSHDRLNFTVFFALGDLCFAMVGHVSLAYPTGF